MSEVPCGEMGACPLFRTGARDDVERHEGCQPEGLTYHGSSLTIHVSSNLPHGQAGPSRERERAFVRIVTAEFMQSCLNADQYPKDGWPEVAFVGRSNVGKSSMINCLLNRKKLAKVSTTPGKTRMLNFFRVVCDDPVLKHLYFVDLPGYGYAKAARSLREQWGPMIEEYLRKSPRLFTVVQLVDTRGLEDHDLTTHQWLKDVGHEPIILGTKVDKLTRNDRNLSQKNIVAAFPFLTEDSLLLSSAKTNEGRLNLWKSLRNRYEQWREEGLGA